MRRTACAQGNVLWHPSSVSGVILWVVVVLVVGGLVAFAAIRLSTRGTDEITVMALFILAAILGIVALSALTFLRKTLAS